MRDIRFRAIDYVNQNWVYGSYVLVNNGIEVVECIWELNSTRATPIDPSTLGEYTGITDVNGTEIYEGDIITADSEYGGIIVNNVYWYCGGFHAGNHTFKQLGNIEVVDNIYNHKQLLKENEK